MFNLNFPKCLVALAKWCAWEEGSINFIFGQILPSLHFMFDFYKDLFDQWTTSILKLDKLHELCMNYTHMHCFIFYACLNTLYFY